MKSPPKTESSLTTGLWLLHHGLQPKYIQMSNIFIPSQAVPVSPTTQSPVHGYPSFAQFVGKETGYAIFRRFASLNAKNLLYLQVELVQLERQLHRLEVQNSRYNESEALQCRVSDLMSAAPGTNAHMQWQKVQEIGEKLERYSM